ncbi:MAG: nuclear transport factor 2 family protein [Lysobacterales bacterium]
MSSRAEVESIVLKFLEALNIDDAGGVPLTEHVEYHGMFSDIPISGEADVREYIDQIAPFMLNETYGKMIIEGGSVAVMTSFDSVNGVHNEGAFFFEVEGDRIGAIRAVFDTRRMFAGKEF